MKILLVLLTLLLALTGCTNIIFFPSPTIYSHPTDHGLKYRDTYFNVNGTRLHAWWVPAKDTAEGTILVLHGNAENISTHIGSVSWLPEKGYNLLLLDYRGYGLSEGNANLNNIYRDILLVIEALTNESEEKIILYGQSLGGTLALRIATEPGINKRLSAVIAESSFSSYRKIAQEKIGQFWLTWPLSYPLSMLFSDRFSPIAKVDKISPTPVLFIHSTEDSIVPFSHSIRLFERASEPKYFLELTGAGHIGAFRSAEARKKILEFLNLYSSRHNLTVTRKN